jgi:hypothetical protein
MLIAARSASPATDARVGAFRRLLLWGKSSGIYVDGPATAGMLVGPVEGPATAGVLAGEVEGPAATAALPCGALMRSGCQSPIGEGGSHANWNAAGKVS